MFKKIFTVFICIILILSLSSCKQVEKKTVVLITDVKGLNDHFYNYLSNEGLKKASREFDFKLTVFQSKKVDDYDENLDKAIKLNPQIIVISSPSIESAAVPYAKNNPDINFIFIDSSGDLNLDNAQDSTNIFSVEFNRSQAGFLSGIVAGSIATSKVLFIGTNEFLSFIEYESGFKAGIKSINAQISTEVVYFNDQVAVDQAKEKTASYIAGGCQVIYTINKNQGIYEAADEAGIPVIGYDYNYSSELKKGSKSLLMYVNKRIDTAVYLAVKEYFDGSFKGQVKFYSISEDCLEENIINDLLMTKDILNIFQVWVNKLKTENITLPKTRKEVDKFNPPVIVIENQNQ